MAGGRLPIPVRLPGTYFTITSEIRPLPLIAPRGTVMAMIPLNWFNVNEAVEINATEFRSTEALAIVGKTAFDFAINRQITCLLNGARNAVIFPQNIGGVKAEAIQGDITWVAKKAGELGNDITVSVIKQNDRYTINTFVRGVPMHTAIVTDIANLDKAIEDNLFVEADFDPDTATFTLGEVMLEGGENGTIPSYESKIETYLQAASLENWDCIAFSMEPDEPNFLTARAAFRDWLIQYNSDMQRMKQGVVIGDGMDSELIIAIHQTGTLNGVELSLSDMVLLRAGHSAAAPANGSETNKIMVGLTDVKPLLNIRAQKDALERGLFTYIKNWDGRYKVLDDINSFVSIIPRKDILWIENRTIRALDTMMEIYARIFNTQFMGYEDNTPTGRTNLRIALDAASRELETSRVIYDHSIDKLIVEAGAGPKDVIARYTSMRVPGSMSRLDFFISISW